jgi:cytochrome P450
VKTAAPPMSGLFGWLCGALLVAIAAALATLWLQRRLQRRRVPSGAKCVPSAPGSVLQQAVALLVHAPWDVMEQWLNATRDGAVAFRFHAHFVVVGSAALARHVFATKQTNYKKDQSTYAIFGDVLGSGLVTSEGERWRRQRALIAPAFKSTMLEAVVPLAYGAAARVAGTLEAARRRGEALDIAEEFRHMTLQVIGEAVLSMTPDACDATLPRLYLPVVTECNVRTWHPYRAYLPLPATFRHRRAVRELNDFVTRFIVDRATARHVDAHGKPAKYAGADADVLDQLIDAAHDGGDDVLGDAEALRQMRDEIKTFLLAGHETSSMMLTWALYELSRHPAELARVRAEADKLPLGRVDAAGKWTGLPDADTLKDLLAYTDCVLKETLRLYSIVPIVSREAVEDDVAEGFFVPAGSHVLIHLQAIHRDPELWDEPLSFKPARFVDQDLLNPKHHRYAFNPFVNGPRSCIGQFFSVLESKIVLALLVRQFDIVPALPADIAGERHPYILPYAPKHGFPVNTTPRSSTK